MTEFFELIMAKPLEFIVGLGVSSATIYSIIKLIKFIFSLIMRNKNKIKQAVERKKIATAVADELNSQVQELKNKMTEILNLLKIIDDKPDCPDELKAFIEALKNQEGNEEFAFFYEQNKEKIKQNKLVAEQNIHEAEQVNQESEPTNPGSESSNHNSGEIDYA